MCPYIASPTVTTPPRIPRDSPPSFSPITGKGLATSSSPRASENMAQVVRTRIAHSMRKYDWKHSRSLDMDELGGQGYVHVDHLPQSSYYDTGIRSSHRRASLPDTLIDYRAMRASSIREGDARRGEADVIVPPGRPTDPGMRGRRATRRGTAPGTQESSPFDCRSQASTRDGHPPLSPSLFHSESRKRAEALSSDWTTCQSCQ
mmetsp:Transcript_11779/g.27372  ORF Transcript_11779/g.27372 Transcript_11779/m.27372 type:complete len:204 (+) Transcript_11779:55-666(+)